jgi:hypothetical protein
LWIHGRGRFASVSYCDGYVTIWLVPSQEEAQRRTREDCSGDNCLLRWHETVDLSLEKGGAAILEREAKRPRRHPPPRLAPRESDAMLPRRPYRMFLSLPFWASSDRDALRQANRYARSLRPLDSTGMGLTELVFEPGDSRGVWVRRLVHCDPGFRPPDPADLIFPDEAIE